MFGNGVIV